MKQTVAVIANTTWYLFNFRLNLMRSLKAAGYEVVAIGPKDEYIGNLEAVGVRHLSMRIEGNSINPLQAFLSIWDLARLVRKEKIDIALCYTPKMNIYTAIAGKLTGVDVVPNISGLGGVFTGHTYLTIVMVLLYRMVLCWSPHVFFQNRDDMNFFVSEGIVKDYQALLVPGSGVDLITFSPKTPTCANRREFVFLLVARMLNEKGIFEYVEAAKKIKSSQNYQKIRFQLLGPLAKTNPAAIPKRMIEEWHRQGVIEYLGSVDDVRPYIRNAECVVLPSYYREGVPRSLLEAAAMGKPIVATNSVGCRDAVDDGRTGYLCNSRDSNDLALKLKQMLNLTEKERLDMGSMGRKKMMMEFDERIVIDRYLRLVAKLCR